MATCQCPGARYLDSWPGRLTHWIQVSGIRSRWLTLLLLLMLTLLSGVSSVDDRCDSVVWDLGGDNVGVRAVSGTCSEGKIEWRNPYGAIRVTLHLRPIRLQKHAVNVAFEACFIVTARDTAIKIFLDDEQSPDLVPLLALNSSHSQMPRELCFASEGGAAVVLYLESELDAHSAAFGDVLLEYDNRRLPVSKDTRNMDDCRPCTDDELIDAVCSSDFALVGTMEHVTHHEDILESNVHVKVKQVFRQSHDIFKDPRRLSERSRRRNSYPKLNIHTENGVREWSPEVDMFSDAPSLSNLDSGQSDGVIFAPHKCGIRKGKGDFLFIGRIRLKRALLQCAPRLEDFNRIWKHAVANERNMCVFR